jgi:histone acetyltransferase (RNA polymerase elongator complex component)
MCDLMPKIISIFVPQQGCPQRCVYCHQPHITGVSIQTSLTPAMLAQTIEITLNEPKSKAKGVRFEVAFYGGTFTGLALDVQEQLLRTAQDYVDRGDLAGIRLSTHPGMVNAERIAFLSNFRVTMVELGVQSFNDEVLRQAQRGHTAQEADAAVVRLQKQGIAVGLHLMIGLPGDTPEISLASAQHAVTLHPAAIRLHPTLVLHHTQLEILYQQGRYTPLSLETAVQTCKAMRQLFRAQQIPVIRIGLQPTVSLETHVVAGPYHPAIGQLVESAVFYDRMEALCCQRQTGQHDITFRVAPQDLSTVHGQKNANIEKLCLRFGFTTVHVLPDEQVQRGEILIG